MTVSELSALGAPTRITWVLLATPYTLLSLAFGWGVLQSATGNRQLRVVAILIIVYSIFNFYWPPMHQRGLEPTLTDILHITWTIITVVLMITMMAFGAVALDARFRIYTIVSMALLVVFGILTSVEAPNIHANGPTPLIGIWERINIGIFMLWVIVLAFILLRKAEINSTRTG
jgi:hypothetical protein